MSDSSSDRPAAPVLDIWCELQCPDCRGALDDVRPTGRRVVPSCWYVAQFIDEHPDYADLLTARS